MKRTLTEANVYMRRHQGAKVKHFDVSNVIYHKFSHGSVSATLNGENLIRISFSSIAIFALKTKSQHLPSNDRVKCVCNNMAYFPCMFKVTLNEKVGEK